MARLVIGDNGSGGKVWLPPEPSQKAAIVGISGSGKSYLAMRMAEEWLLAGENLGVLDPVGIWWGLRCGADGGPGGGMPIHVFGGLRGDHSLPEPWEAARFWAMESNPSIFDLSTVTIEYMHWWVTRFVQKLGELGPWLRRPAHLAVEEATMIAPQRGSLSRHQRDCRAAVAQYARVYRNFGLGMTLITQRMASVDKDILNLCGTLFAMRMAAELDRAPIRDWCATNLGGLDINQTMRDLSVMPPGNGMLWAPGWAEGPLRACRFRTAARTTFHPDPRDPSRTRAAVLCQLPVPLVRAQRRPWWEAFIGPLLLSVTFLPGKVF